MCKGNCISTKGYTEACLSSRVYLSLLGIERDRFIFFIRKRVVYEKHAVRASLNSQLPQTETQWVLPRHGACCKHVIMKACVNRVERLTLTSLSYPILLREYANIEAAIYRPNENWFCWQWQIKPSAIFLTSISLMDKY